MKLDLMTPERRLAEEEAVKIVAEGSHGAFVLLPRHADAVIPLPPGVLGWDGAGGVRRWVGHDDAVLVKCGEVVSVAARRAVLGDSLEALRRTVRREFLAYAEHERDARRALARLEAGVMRRLMDLEGRP
jgi:F-type H+-transporting ATPase subunit epsilon